MSENISKPQNPFEEIVIHLRGSITEEINCQLLGQVLTIVDSAIVDKQQNKAIKDLIKNAFFKTSRDMMLTLKEDIYRKAKQEGQEIKGDQSEHFGS